MPTDGAGSHSPSNDAAMNAPIATADKPISLVDGEAIQHAISSTQSSPPEFDADDRARGRDADTPSEIPPLGWKDIGWRLWEEFNKDRVLLIAAGATFYLLLALFPALAAFVSLYGFVADPATVADHIAYLGGLLPTGGLDHHPTAAAGVVTTGSQRAGRRLLRRPGHSAVERQQWHQGALRCHEHRLRGDREAQLRDPQPACRSPSPSAPS